MKKILTPLMEDCCDFKEWLICKLCQTCKGKNWAKSGWFMGGKVGES